jgi:hypothetical protein
VAMDDAMNISCLEGCMMLVTYWSFGVFRHGYVVARTARRRSNDVDAESSGEEVKTGRYHEEAEN